MEWKSDSPCCSHTYPRQECRSPGRHRSWELEFRDCGAIPGRGLLLLWRDRLRECEGGDCGGKCLWRKAGQPWKQGNTAESCIVGGAITIASLSPHASIGTWTVKRLAHQTPDALHYRVGPHPGCPFKCLKCRSMGRNPAKGAPLCAWRAEQQRRIPGKGALYVPERAELWGKTGQRGLLIASYKRLEKRLIGP